MVALGTDVIIALVVVGVVVLLIVFVIVVSVPIDLLVVYTAELALALLRMSQV